MIAQRNGKAHCLPRFKKYVNENIEKLGDYVSIKTDDYNFKVYYVLGLLSCHSYIPLHYSNALLQFCSYVAMAVHNLELICKPGAVDSSAGIFTVHLASML